MIFAPAQIGGCAFGLGKPLLKVRDVALVLQQLRTVVVQLGFRSLQGLFQIADTAQQLLARVVQRRDPLFMLLGLLNRFVLRCAGGSDLALARA